MEYFTISIIIFFLIKFSEDVLDYLYVVNHAYGTFGDTIEVFEILENYKG